MAVEFVFGLNVSSMFTWNLLSPDEQALLDIATIDGDAFLEASDIEKAYAEANTHEGHLNSGVMFPSQLALYNNQSRYAWGRDTLLNGLSQRLSPCLQLTRGQLCQDVILSTATHLTPDQILKLEDQLNAMESKDFTQNYTSADWQATAVTLTVLANASALERLMLQEKKSFGFDVIDFASQATTAITSGELKITHAPAPANHPNLSAEFVPNETSNRWGQIKCYQSYVPADLLFHELYHTWQFFKNPQTESKGSMAYEPQAYLAGGFYRVASGMDDSSLSELHQFDDNFLKPKEKFMKDVTSSLAQAEKDYKLYQYNKSGPIYAMAYTSHYLQLRMGQSVPELGNNPTMLAAKAAQTYFANPNNKAAIDDAQKRVKQAYFSNVGPFNDQQNLGIRLFEVLRRTASASPTPITEFLSRTVANMGSAPLATDETPFNKAEAQFKLHYFKAMQLAAEGKIEEAKRYIDSTMIPFWLDSALVN